MPEYIEAHGGVDWLRFFRIIRETERALKRAPRSKRKVIRDRAARRAMDCVSVKV